MKNIIFLTLLLSLLISCKRNCFRDLTNEEKGRIAYKGGEVIVFKHQSGSLDTLFINGAISEGVSPKNENCRDDKKYFSIYGIFKNKLNANGNGNGITFGTSITAPSKKDDSFVYPEIGTAMGYFPIGKSTPLTSININGKQLYNVYEITNGGHNPAVLDVDKIFFSFEYGLLKIVLHDGGYWERINY